VTLGWCGFAVAQNFEPQPLPQDVSARPISEADASSSNVLRWKTRPSVTGSEYVASEASVRPVGQSQRSPAPLRAGWNITRIDPAVRPVQHTTADPFADPFGDRKVKAEPELVLQPTQAEAGIEELPPPRTLSPVRRAVPQTPIFTIAQPESALRAAPPDATLPTDPPCDRKYNDRNCCALEEACHKFRDALLQDSIRNISLDITPPFKHDPNVTNEEARVDKLRRQGSRPWRNRRGALMATGQMTNIEFGAVVVSDDNGTVIARVPINELGEDELCFVSALWDLPSECPLGGLRNASRSWLCSTFHYNASALCHKPLYFEEPQLERYGHTAGPFRQPLISGAHMVLNLAMLPYHMGINPPTECQYPLGYYRPGSCAPWMIPPFPLSLEGAKAEIAVALGMIYLIP
jgi:hypothetical protein